MKCLFCQTTPYRKREYQVTTKFVRDVVDGHAETFVEKYNTCNEGKDNIIRIYHISQKLKAVYGRMFSPAVLEHGKLISEFYNDAISLDFKLMSSIQENDFFGVVKLLNLWKSIICSNNNMCTFMPTQEFKFFFSTNGEQFIGACATMISNLDCSGENILFLPSKDDIKVIDYEWAFDFPIPVEFIVYYNFSLFCKKHGRKDLLDKLLKMVNIDCAMCSLYDDMILHFYDTISIDGKIDYRQMGMYFLQPKYNDAFQQIEYKYPFPIKLIPAGKNVVIYGLGAVGRDYVDYVCNSSIYKLAGCIDQNAESLKEQYGTVVRPENVLKLCFDYVILAICNKRIALQMKDVLLKCGVDENKIIWDEERFT